MFIATGTRSTELRQEFNVYSNRDKEHGTPSGVQCAGAGERHFTPDGVS